MDADDILEEVWQFIMNHQGCAEDNPISPKATKNRIYMTCDSCGDKITVGSEEDART